MQLHTCTYERARSPGVGSTLKRAAAAIAVAIGLTATSAGTLAAGPKPPIVLEKSGTFFVGGEYNAAEQMVGQMYVEYQIPLAKRYPYPIVFVHGGGQIGAAWWETPDGREGWAPYFLRKGFAVYVVDQAGRGRSAYHSDLGGLGDASGATRALQLWVAQERYDFWPAADLHTQWPGYAEVGEPTFEQFMRSQSDAMTDARLQEELTAAGLVALLDRIGPAIIIPHSQPGAPAWLVADQRPNLVKALVQLEPGGPAVYRDLPAQGFPLGPTFAWGLTRNPITYDPPVTDPNQLEFEKVPVNDPWISEVWVQKEPARQLVNVAKVPILLLTAPSGYNTVWDPGTHAYLEQAGVEHTWLKLADIGIQGNGHFMFIEKNSDQIAGVVLDWIKQNVDW